jgi:hypothetical protein
MTVVPFAQADVAQTACTPWRVDSCGYLLTPGGAKVARVADGVIYLYDRRLNREYPFTVDDYWQVTRTV